MSAESEEQVKRLTKGPNVLSWDCGISNLCYCLLEDVQDDSTQEGTNFRIVMWENFSLNSQTLMQAVDMLVKELDKRPWMLDVDYVCIESQTLKNVQMKVLSHAIQCYFVTKGEMRAQLNGKVIELPDGTRATQKGPVGPPVSMIKPESKFKAAKGIVIPDEIESLQRRRRNKRAAIHMAMEILQHRERDVTAYNFLQSFDKQDDLCDSFLQGIYFLDLMRQKRVQNQKVRNYLKGAITISIDSNTGTKDETFDEGVQINEGCEYEREVPLPQVYRAEHFVIPTYDKIASGISGATRFVRRSG